MNYFKKPFDHESDENVRRNLSTMEDARIPGSDTRLGHGRVLPVPQCDWCGEAEPVVVYAAKRTTDGRSVPCWRWATCERCDKAVMHDNWDALQRRMASQFKKFFTARLAVEYPGRPVPDSLINEAIAHSLDDFHQYAIRMDDPERDTLKQLLPGGGKS